MFCETRLDTPSRLATAGKALKPARRIKPRLTKMTTTAFERTLQVHSNAPWVNGIAIHVAGHWSTQQCLSLRYTLSGAGLGEVCVPSPQQPAFADGLWRHTCFEAFVSAADAGGAAPLSSHPYREFNWSPSGQWAQYPFGSERVPASSAHAPHQAAHTFCQHSDHHWTLDAHIPLDGATNHTETAWWLALTAVLEHQDGRLSYWALHHPCPQPDFHHPAGRTLRVAQPA